MKKQAASVFAALSLLLALGIATVSAQSSAKIIAKIPFNFSAQNTNLEAGDYTVQPALSHVILLRGPDGGMFVQTIGVDSTSTQGETKLVFNRYGDKYFLSQVWTAGDTRGRQLLKSRAERELAKMASVPAPETVVLLAEQ